eukprot:7487416-Pyramimonas_sp.AAC.3
MAFGLAHQDRLREQHPSPCFPPPVPTAPHLASDGPYRPRHASDGREDVSGGERTLRRPSRVPVEGRVPIRCCTSSASKPSAAITTTSLRDACSTCSRRHKGGR